MTNTQGAGTFAVAAGSRITLHVPASGKQESRIRKEGVADTTVSSVTDAQLLLFWTFWTRAAHRSASNPSGSYRGQLLGPAALISNGIEDEAGGSSEFTIRNPARRRSWKNTSRSLCVFLGLTIVFDLRLLGCTLHSIPFRSSHAVSCRGRLSGFAVMVVPSRASVLRHRS